MEPGADARPAGQVPGGPTNNSFRNTGQQTLPAARPSWIRYAGDAGSPPEFGSGSESPMGGPVYRYDAANPSTIKFPQSLDGKFFAGEFGRRWIKAITVNGDGSPGTIDAFPWSGMQIMDQAFGPNGALYVLDYGAGFGNGDANSALYRIEYIGGGNRAPVTVASANRTSGPAPLAVNFSSAGSSDPEGQALTYSWAFGDGTTSTAANPTKTYSTNGTYVATLTVRDPQGATGSSSVTISVGNTGGYGNYTDVTTTLSAGSGALFLGPHATCGSTSWPRRTTPTRPPGSTSSRRTRPDPPRRCRRPRPPALIMQLWCRNTPGMFRFVRHHNCKIDT